MNASLRFEAITAVDDLRSVLLVREQQGLEYVFARGIVETCLGPSPTGAAVYEVLLERFRAFDRRRNEMTLAWQEVPLVCREAHLRHLVNVRTRNASLFRAIHLAAAIDCDGPRTMSEEKQAIFAIFCRVLTGASP